MLQSIVLLLLLLSIVEVEVLGFSSAIRSTQRSKFAQLHGRYRQFCLNSNDDIATGGDQCTTATTSISVVEDAYTSFPLFDKFLFFLFARSVTEEMGKKSEMTPRTYNELMSLINEMTKTRSIQRVNDQGKNMLKRLFPPWLLTQYKWMFAAPFPEVCLNCH